LRPLQAEGAGRTLGRLSERAAGVDLQFLGPPGLEGRPTSVLDRRPGPRGRTTRSVGPWCQSGFVRVTEADIARIPVGNLRVSWAAFGTVWAAAEDRDWAAAAGVAPWYRAGVAATCRWLAGARVESVIGGRRLAPSPVGGREVLAYEELIEAEYLAAEQLGQRCPDLVEHRPGWCEAMAATLRWAWRHEGPAPLPVLSPAPAGGIAAG